MVETIKFKLSANVDELAVEFTTKKEKISSWALQGIHSDIMIKASYTQINAKLDQIIIRDLNPHSIHSRVITFLHKKLI